MLGAVFVSSRAKEEADERDGDDGGERRDEYHGGGIVACGALCFREHGKRDHRRHGGEETERDDHVFGKVPPAKELAEEYREQAHLADDTAVELDALYGCRYLETREERAEIDERERCRDRADSHQRAVDGLGDTHFGEDGDERKHDTDGGRVDHLHQTRAKRGRTAVYRCRQIDADRPLQKLVDDRKETDVEHTVLGEYGADDGDAHKADVAEHDAGTVDILLVAL